MRIRLLTYGLIALLTLIRFTIAGAQTSLTLTYGDPAASPESAFDGNVFQAGTEIGDAVFYARFGGTGTRYFEIDSPGENVTKQVSSDGFVTIRPVANTVIDQSKIKAFSGAVSGSIVITVKPLSLTTVNTNVTTEVAPSSEIIVYYRTGAGTFPVGLVARKFSVQLLTADGTLVGELLNVTDQYSGREQAGFSAGGLRSIKATIPTATASGVYRVRVITQGLINNVLGSPSASFTVRANTSTVTAISAGSVSSSYCAGSTVSFPFSTTGTFPGGNAFKVQLVNSDGSVLQDLPGTSSSSPISVPLPASLTSGTYRFQITATATNVQSNTGSFAVSALPTMTISGGSTITAGATAPIRLDFTGTAPWSFTYTNNGTTTAGTSPVSSITITPTFVSPATFDKSFIKAFVDSRCGVSNAISGSAQITVGQLTLVTGSLSGTYCPGTTVAVPFTASPSLPAGVIYLVQLSDASGSFLNTQTIGSGTASPVSAFIPTTLLAGTGYRVQVVVQKPTTSGTTDYSNSVNPVPSSLIVSRPDYPIVANLSICAGTPTGPLSATGVNLKWYTSSTSSQPLNNAPTPSNSQSSLYYVSQTINGCESARQPLSVSINTTPSAPIVNSVTLCQGAQGQFSSSVPNALWYTAATGGMGSAQPPALNNQTAADQIVYVSQTVNGCESQRTAVKATVNALPTTPTPASVTLCQYSTASALTATGSSLTWYGPSGKLPGAPTPNTSLAGIQSYSVTQTVNTCESTQATINILIQTAPTPPVVTASRFCVGESPRSLTATGLSLKWYLAASGGTGSTNSPSFPTDAATAFIFYVSQTDANGCESTRQPMSVSIVAAPSTPTVNSVSFCQGGQGQFSSSVPNALWYTSATGGSGAAQPPSLNNQTAGDQTVYLTQTVNGCESARAAVKATVYAIPAAPATPTPTYVCQFSGANSLTATGSSLTWYNQAGKLPGAPTPSTSLAGSQSYSVTQTVNTCESPRTAVSVVVRPAPSVPISNSASYCIGQVPSPLTAVGLNLRWYTTATSGVSSNTSPAFFTQTATVYTFYVTQTDSSSCESLRLPVSVSVAAPPPAPSVTANQIVCQSSKVGSLTASPGTGLSWQGSGIAGSSETAPIPVTSQPGTFTYLVTQKIGACTSPAAQINVTVAPTPAAPGVQSSIAFCIGTASVSLSATGSNLTWYTTADHSGPALTRILPNTTQAGVTTYYVTQKDANTCESLNSSIEVRVSPKATATISGDGTVYPGDSTALRVRLTGDARWTFTTDWNAKQIIINNSKDSLYVAWVRPASTTLYTISNLTSNCGPGDAVKSYELRVNIPLGTQSTPEPISITVYPNPTADELTVDWRSPVRQMVTLQLINATGTLIQQVTRSSTTTSQTEIFQLGNQPAGLYFLRVKTPTNGVITKPIVKQ